MAKKNTMNKRNVARMNTLLSADPKPPLKKISDILQVEVKTLEKFIPKKEAPASDKKA